MQKKSNKMKILLTIFTCLSIFLIFTGCANQHRSCDGTPQQKFIALELDQQPQYQPLLKGIPQTCGMRSGRVYLKPGEECGQHSTNTNEEMLIFISGKGTAFIGEEKIAHEVVKDNIIYIPPYLDHNIKNTGSDPLIYVYCVAPVK
jgi:quercetin dioxygenase-like cupin family protein